MENIYNVEEIVFCNKDYLIIIPSGKRLIREFTLPAGAKIATGKYVNDPTKDLLYVHKDYQHYIFEDAPT